MATNVEASILRGNKIESTGLDEKEGDVRWILPGQRQLDPNIFGTPMAPLGFEPDVGVPIEARLTNEDGTAFTTTAGPTPFSDNFALINGAYELSAVDNTLADDLNSQDKVYFRSTFTSPGGEISYELSVNSILPVGVLHPVFGGVATNMIHHGTTGIGTKLQPTVPTYGAFWGIGTLKVNGQVPDEGRDRLVHGMITSNVRNEEYELVFDDQVDTSKIHTHLFLPPFQIAVNEGGEFAEVPRPVPTGFVLPNGMQQPFLHIMYENIGLKTVTDVAAPKKDDFFLIEAEDLDLETYLVEDREVASNEKVISLLGSGDAGTASTKFTGPSGLYTVVVGYYDEIDGESLFRLKVNDDIVDNWRADQELDPRGFVPTENNFTRRTIGGIELQTGDVLAIEGFRDAQEYARVDFLQLIPSTVDVPPSRPDDELGKVIVGMNLIDPDGIGAKIGTIKAEDTQYGLLLTPDLSGLTPGVHGFHVHENPDCGPGERDGQVVPGLAAGGHYDPENTGRHEGPYGDGHLGDLPPLIVGADGTATLPLLAPRLEVADLTGRSLMIHQGGDNFSDLPEPLGGGGARIACGVV